MSVKISEIVDVMNEFAPPETAENWDNVGLLLGNPDGNVDKILIALDVTNDVIDEAVDIGAGLIITHHPFIFKPVKTINYSDFLGKRIYKLIKNDISVFSAHTNLDKADMGTNHALANKLKLRNIKKFSDIFFSDNIIGVMGEIETEVTFKEFAENIKKYLGIERITVTGDFEKKIKKVGLCTGSGMEFVSYAQKAGCDAYVSGDMKYHEAQTANNIDICVADVSHYYGEVIIVPVLKEYLEICAKKYNFDFKCVQSKINSQTLKII